MSEIKPYYRRQRGLGLFPVAVLLDKSVEANDTLLLRKEDYPDLVIYLKTTEACDLILEAVSAAPRKPDLSYAKIPVNETLISLNAGEEKTIRLSEVLQSEWALHYPYLHLKFSSSTTINLAAFPITTTTTETLKQKLSIEPLIIHSTDSDIAVSEAQVVEVSKLEVHAPRKVFNHGIIRVHSAPYVESGASIYVAPGASLDIW